MKTKIKSSKVTVGELASLLKVREPQDYINDCLDSCDDEQIDEAYREYYDSFMRACEFVFDAHGMMLEGCPQGKEDVRPWEYKIIPKEGWEQACRAIMNTVNGVGMFGYSSLKEFLECGPYTFRSASMSHLSYLKRHSEVYGEVKLQDRIYKGLR
jgi:hypothetical protein